MINSNELQASHRVLSLLEYACEYSEKILDNIPNVFVVLNQQNKVIRANHAFCALVGCSMEDALHLDFASFFTIENRDILMRHLTHLRASEQGESSAQIKLEFAGIDADAPSKSFHWHIFQLEHVSHADGRVLSIIGDDLSGLYQTELKLMSIFSSIPLGLLVLDKTGVIEEVLSEYCHVLLNRRVLTGEPLQVILSTENADQRAELGQIFYALRECIGKESAFFTTFAQGFDGTNYLCVNRGSPNEKWIRPRFQPIVKNNIVDRYMVILEDSTDNVSAQRQVEKADLLGRQARALYECAIRDPLSGLYTRLFMNDSVKRLVADFRRGNVRELSLLLFDIDNFKNVNDTHGHAAGDIVIREFGGVIRRCLRDTDIPVRYGGEEFIVAAPNNDTNEHGSSILAERIRSQLEGTDIDIGNGKTIRVTVSCGVALCRQNENLEQLIERADTYLYAAKHYGRNRVCTNSEGEE
ncbi:MAG: diguanylate cyclase [Pseudomonadota bacterium]